MTAKRSLVIFPLLLIVVQFAPVRDVWSADGVEGDSRPLIALVHRLSSDDASLRQSAATELERRNSQAAELLGRFDGDCPDRLREYRREATPLVPLVMKCLRSNDDEACAAAACLLSVIGSDAAAAHSALLEVIRSSPSRSPKVVRTAVHALMYVAPRNESVGMEMHALYLRLCGLRDSEENGPPNRDAVGLAGVYLAQQLVFAGRIDAEIPVLVKALEGNSRPEVRRVAIAALAALGQEAEAGVPTLQRLLTNGDPEIRQTSGFALLRIQDDAGIVESLLTTMRLDPVQAAEFKSMANEIIASNEKIRRLMRDNARVPDLIQLVRSGNPFYERHGIRLLGECGERARDAIPDLMRSLSSEQSATRKAACEALKRIDPGRAMDECR